MTPASISGDEHVANESISEEQYPISMTVPPASPTPRAKASARLFPESRASYPIAILLTAINVVNAYPRRV